MNEIPPERIRPEDGGPLTESPDLRRVNGFKQMLGRVWADKSFGPLGAYMFVPAHTPGDFAREPLENLAARLKTDDLEVAKALLAEAEAIFREPQDRIDGAERRATTLQGAVAIAASVAVAGAGLLFDPTKVHGQGWRISFGVLVLVFVLCLTACAIRALGATSRIFRFVEPGPQRIGDRAGMGACDALVHRAAELLRSSEVANQIGRVKVGLLRSAAWWFRAAILSLAVLAGLIAAYAIAGSRDAASTPKSAMTVSHEPREHGPLEGRRGWAAHNYVWCIDT